MKPARIARLMVLPLCVCLCISSQLPAQHDPAIGLLSKVILDVNRKPVGNDWVKAERGETLDSGDMVRTGAKSLAVVKFKDNSLLRVRERSQVTLTGLTSAGAFSKDVNIGGGAVGFSVKKQQPGEEFRFISPTSVASVRGTMGVFAIQDTFDLLIVTEGIVNLRNIQTGESVDVEAGKVGLSFASGRLETRPAVDNDIEEFQQIFGRAEGESGGKQLKLQLRNERGEIRDLIIEIE
jgi:hypothetical protein